MFKRTLIYLSIICLVFAQVSYFPDTVSTNDETLFGTTSTQYIVSSQYFGSSTDTTININKYGIKITPFKAVWIYINYRQTKLLILIILLQLIVYGEIQNRLLYLVSM